MQDPQIDLDIRYHVPNLQDDSERFQQCARWVSGQFRLLRLTTSIAIVDDPTIHQINRTHLEHDWPTDVISFQFETGNSHVDGEIIASSDTARKVHQQAGWSIEDELLLYVIHGLLHLVGLDDLTDQDRQQMRTLEQCCLSAMGVKQADNHMERWEDIAY